ncbi:MAG: hypothetical protein K9J27_08945 [Bacteroidales bacterium]|nr:hypothetical protein [Bacteroidales bacterium]MCF8333513.1 hypothetical protein [Bacteroidales bacterium]
MRYRFRNDKDRTMDYTNEAIWKLSGYPASHFIGNASLSYNSITIQR